MSKRIQLMLVAGLITVNVSSQTLFTYGPNKASAAEFLRAFSKNNVKPAPDKAKAISEYLDLYIKSKLKVAEAYARRYDTLPQLKMDVNNLRTQIAENYMTDPGMMQRLTKEAFDRSQKDVHFAHIFISFRSAAGFVDTVAANKKKDEVLQRLAKGENFLQVAQQLSDDPLAKSNKGDAGFITSFSLPYEFETAVYNTPVGKYSTPVRSKNGLHIFKKLEERKAAGKMKAQQILLAFPPEADEQVKKQIAARADSIYKLLLKGENFNKLASAFSNDYISAANNGVMPDVAVGQYDAAFEKQLWSLKKDGDLGKPFQTNYGWHIVKRVTVKPVVNKADDKDYQRELQQKIVTDGRWKTSKDFIYEKVNRMAGVKKYPYDDEALWAMSDSVLDQKPMKEIGKKIIATTPLFSIGDSVYDATVWVNYANGYRYKQDGSGVKPYEQVREEWIKHEMFNYYRDHLEDFNDDFKNQMTEFKDGNLFFEIMQQEIWNKAQSDSAALVNLYNKNKAGYLWKQSAEAVIFFCSDSITAQVLYKSVKANPGNWKNLSDQYAEKVIADSSRYEWDQIPFLGKTTPAEGLVSPPVVNVNDNTASFAYIIRTYPQPTQRSFNEAKGLVMNDYQEILEKKWDEALKKKYPVMIDKKVLQEISK